MNGVDTKSDISIASKGDFQGKAGQLPNIDLYPMILEGWHLKAGQPLIGILATHPWRMSCA
jgi:hypothetical protein